MKLLLHTRFLCTIIVSVITVPHLNASYLRKSETITKSLFAAFTPLETERLILRHITPEDAENLFDMLSRSEVIDTTAGLERHTSIDQTNELIEQVIKSYSEHAGYDWSLLAITEKATGKFAGFCGFLGYLPLFNRAELGYALLPHYWGKGFASEAAHALVDFGFNQVGLNRIEATVFPENGASVRVLEKAGMEREGFLRQHVIRNGEFRNRLIYAVLRDDWTQEKFNKKD